MAHHLDYLNASTDRALCGAALENPAALDPTIRPLAVCPDCEAKLVEYHLKWWRERAESTTAELDELRVKYRELAEHLDNQRRGVAGVSAESPAETAGEPLADSTAEQGGTTSTPLLDQARKELLELCRRFDDAVPYWRVKKGMDAFSDKLDSEERVLLAQEIGADGSLIRWCTREIEGLGWQVTNSPVHSDADSMTDAWTDDYYQTPKKTKWRPGRSRAHDAS